jgi:hypothetical protein
MGTASLPPSPRTGHTTFVLLPPIIEHATHDRDGDLLSSDEESERDRSANRSWWADALNPVENLRALADVQEFGRRAAEDLADRLLARGGGRDGTFSGASVPDAELYELVRRFRAEAVRAVDVWTNLLDNLATLFITLTSRPPRRSESEAGASSVVLETVPPGADTTGLFWVHNTSPAPVSSVRPHCAPLRSHLGYELPPDAIRFEPRVLDPLPARSSCGIEVRLSVPSAAPPGTYMSVILASNVPELYLPLRVTVKPRGVEA